MRDVSHAAGVSETSARADARAAAPLAAVWCPTRAAISARRRLSRLSADAEFIAALGGVARKSRALFVERARLTRRNRSDSGTSLGVRPRCRECSNRRNQHRRRSGKCQLANEVAARDVNKRCRRIRRRLEQVRTAQLLQRERKEGIVGSNVEASRKLRRDAFACPSAFLEQLQDAGRRRIEEMHSIIPGIVYEHLIVESVAQQS